MPAEPAPARGVTLPAQPSPTADAPAPPAKAPAPRMPTYDAREMMRDGVQACLQLDETLYFLRITRAGKLILTK